MSVEAQEKAELGNRVVELEGEMGELVDQLERLVKEREDRDEETSHEEIAAYKSRIVELEEDVNAHRARLEAAVSELTQRLEDVVKDKAAIEATNARMQAELGVSSEESEALTEKIASLEAELAKSAENAARASSSDTSDQLLARLEDANREKEVLVVASAKMQTDLMSANALLEDAINQREVAEKELADVVARIADLEASTATASAATATPDPRIEQEMSALKAENASLQARLQSNNAALLRSSDQKQKDEQIASMATELARVKDSLAAEKRRATQLEELAASQTAGNKILDDDHDMEAAALAGGGAFKPLVGIVRSLPPALGNNAFINETAKKLDKAAVALDARPAIRAAVILYIVLLHLVLLI